MTLNCLTFVLSQMSVPEDLPEMEGADLLGLLFQDGIDGSTEPFFPDGNGLIESWLSEQDVRSMLITSLSSYTGSSISAINMTFFLICQSKNLVEII